LLVSSVADDESGSLVVDEHTLSIYGHVVASNALGQAYVSSFPDTVRQIQNVKEGATVTLPSPETLLANLQSYYENTGEPQTTVGAALTALVSESLRQLKGLDFRRRSRTGRYR
jgi:hypothetical protein